jgi:hypothetical protein
MRCARPVIEESTLLQWQCVGVVHVPDESVQARMSGGTRRTPRMRVGVLTRESLDDLTFRVPECQRNTTGSASPR